VNVRLPRWLYWVIKDRAAEYQMPPATFIFYMLARANSLIDATKTTDQVTEWLLEMYDAATLEQLQKRLESVERNVDEAPPWE
jgi:hypothetical protein